MIKEYSAKVTTTSTCRVLFTSISHLGEYIPPTVRRALFIYQNSVATIAHTLPNIDGVEFYRYEIPDSESAKQLSVAEGCWTYLAQNNFTRSDLIITFGGGAALDLSGFVASCYLRGIEVIYIPTTLLGMVDAAIGGKTGVNLREGKNLVGSFYPPKLVLCDISALRTLPEEHIQSGLAEIIKCGFIRDQSILEILENFLECSSAAAPVTRISDLLSHNLEDLIHKAVAVKLDHIQSDFRDTAERQFLNYGHTLAHALEIITSHRILHGHAVSIGMIFAARVSLLEGLIDKDILIKHQRILRAYNLPVCLPDFNTEDANRAPDIRGATREYLTHNEETWKKILLYIRRDKKNICVAEQNQKTYIAINPSEQLEGEYLKLVLLSDIGKPVLHHVSPATLFRAYEDMYSSEEIL